jgi:hapalindole-type alkaloid chlorinase
VPKGAQLYHWNIEDDGTAYRYALEDDTYLKTFELGGRPNGPRVRCSFTPPTCDRQTLLDVAAQLVDPESYLLPDRDVAVDRDQPADEAAFVHWTTLDVTALGEDPDALGRMLDGDLDGLTVTGAIDPEVARHATEALGTVQPSVFAEMGSVAPIPLLSVVDDFEPYLESARTAAPSVDRAFGCSIVDLVSSTLERIAGGLPVEVASSGGRRYLPGTFRTAAPGHGGLRAHCANLFHEMNRERGLKELDEHLELVDGISWFFVLQPPGAGGSLRLFDARWPDDPTCRPAGARWAEDDTGVEAVPSAVVSPRVGDLVVFRGGDLWHAVDDVVGDAPRITYCGFMARRRDRSGYEFWS